MKTSKKHLRSPHVFWEKYWVRIYTINTFMDSVWERIYNSALHFLTIHDKEQMYHLVVKEAINLVDADYGSVFLVKKEVPVRVFSSYRTLYNVEARAKGKVYSAFKNGTPVLISSPKESDHSELRILGVRSEIIVPLLYGGMTVGVLSILSKKQNLKEEELDKLMIFAPLATLAIRNMTLNEDLKKAIESRNLFMSLASHELKTPLTVISLYSDSLAKKVSTESGKRDAEKIKSAIKRVNYLVNEFLEVDSYNKGELHYKFNRTNLYDLIKSVVLWYKNDKLSPNINYNLNENREFETFIDQEKIREVLINVLNNAIKFSPEASEIDIETKQKNGKFYISVTDHGEGISKNNLTNIFGRFYKGTSKKTGMGLGLYLAKKIMRTHKGEIEVKSQLGKGTTVVITLPKR